MRKAQSSGPGTYAAFFEAAVPAVFRDLRRTLRRRHIELISIHEDIVADTVSDLYSAGRRIWAARAHEVSQTASPPQLEPAELAALAQTILHRRIMDVYRLRAHFAPVSGDAAAHAVSPAAGTAPDAESESMRYELLDRLGMALESLSDDERALLRTIALQGSARGLHLGAVDRKRLSRLRRHLREALDVGDLFD